VIAEDIDLSAPSEPPSRVISFYAACCVITPPPLPEMTEFLLPDGSAKEILIKILEQTQQELICCFQFCFF